jgi:hypothetical protein
MTCMRGGNARGCWYSGRGSEAQRRSSSAEASRET